MGLAVSASLFGCARSTNDTVSAQTAASALAVGERLAAQDRADTARHRAELAKLLRIDGVAVHEDDRTMRIGFVVHNPSAKDVKRLEMGFEAKTPDGKSIAMTELRTNANVHPKSSSHVMLVIPYVQFGEDTGAMREAVGKPQRFTIDVKEIKYADGSDAGYDD